MAVSAEMELQRKETDTEKTVLRSQNTYLLIVYLFR